MVADFICALILLEVKAMLHKLKIIAYSLIILFVLILPSQAVAQCLTKDECAAAAEAQGLQRGGADYDFAGTFRTKGCYSYESGKYKGMAYFGTGGTESEMAAVPAPPKYRMPCAPSAPDTQPGLAAISEVEGDAQCNTPEACADAAAADESLTYVDAKKKYGTKGCYAYSTGNYAGSVYFGMGGTTDEENNAVPDPPKYRFCGPNKTDPTSAWYIKAEKEAEIVAKCKALFAAASAKDSRAWKEFTQGPLKCGNRDINY